MRDARVRRLLEQNRRSHFRRCGRSLDSKSALPRAPEEVGYVGVEAVDRQPVGREGPEARPASFNAFDGPVDNAFESIDGLCDVDLFGRGVAWIGCDLVVRAEPDRSIPF